MFFRVTVIVFGATTASFSTEEPKFKYDVGFVIIVGSPASTASIVTLVLADFTTAFSVYVAVRVTSVWSTTSASCDQTTLEVTSTGVCSTSFKVYIALTVRPSGTISSPVFQPVVLVIVPSISIRSSTGRTPPSWFTPKRTKRLSEPTEKVIRVSSANE